MYREVWRIERDFFYDRNIHGFDLKAAEKKYEPYVSGIASRRDLTYLFQEMLGDMVVGHLGTGGGDMPQVKRVPTGMLGADYEIANGHYRFSRIYSGENWNPQLRAPLTQPGVNVQAGEYLFEVIMRRYETRSTMMTSNRPLEDWGKLVGDVPSATAILDRFLHHAEVVTITGKSYRLRDRASAKPTGKAARGAQEKSKDTCQDESK